LTGRETGIDEAAALQSAVDAGGIVTLPAGTIRLNAPLVVSRPVTIAGSPGTVIDYGGASGAAVTVAGGGVTLANLDIRGPGGDAMPILVDAHDTDGLTVTGCRFSGTGYAGIALEGCTGTEIRGCTFDTIYPATGTGYGHGVMVLNRSDRTAIRENRFIGRGGEWIAASVRGRTTTPPAEWPGEIVVENNYFADSVGCACDSHLTCNGPYVIRNNLAVRCAGGLAGLANTERGAVIEGNVSTGGEGVRVLNKNPRDEAAPPKVDIVQNNLIDSDTNYAVVVTGSDARIAGNVLRYAVDGPAVWIGATVPRTGIEVAGNVYGGPTDHLIDRPALVTAAGNVYRKRS
jgi:parallel beta-helix repeat protein